MFWKGAIVGNIEFSWLRNLLSPSIFPMYFVNNSPISESLLNSEYPDRANSSQTFSIKGITLDFINVSLS